MAEVGDDLNFHLVWRVYPHSSVTEPDQLTSEGLLELTSKGGLIDWYPSLTLNTRAYCTEGGGRDGFFLIFFLSFTIPALWVRIQTSLKNPKMVDISKGVDRPISPVGLSSRLQRGYNSVGRAEFQRREWQIRSSSVQFSARLRGSRASQICENSHYYISIDRRRTSQFTKPARPPSESASRVTIGWFRLGTAWYLSNLFPISATPSPVRPYLQGGLSLPPYPSSTHHGTTAIGSALLIKLLEASVHALISWAQCGNNPAPHGTKVPRTTIIGIVVLLKLVDNTLCA